MEDEGQGAAQPPEGSISLKIRVHGIRLAGAEVPESVKVSYSYEALDWRGETVVGETQSVVSPDGKHEFGNFLKEHFLPQAAEDREKIFLKLTQDPVVFQLKGLHSTPGTCKVPGKELVFFPGFDPYADRPFPGPFVTGWFPVTPSEEAEGFPRNVEVELSLELSEPVCPDAELADANVITITVKELYNLPKSWALAEGDEGGESSVYSYTARYSLPGAAIKQVEASPGSMVAATAAAGGTDTKAFEEDSQPATEQPPSGQTSGQPEVPDLVELQHTGSLVSRKRCSADLSRPPLPLPPAAPAPGDRAPVHQGV